MICSMITFAMPCVMARGTQGAGHAPWQAIVGRSALPDREAPRGCRAERSALVASRPR